MIEKKGINRDHPRYNEYIEKCEQVFSKYDLLIEEERAKSKEWSGLDNPFMETIISLQKECSKKLRIIQKEYSYLF